MGYEGLQASSWFTVIFYLVVSAIFGGLSSWYYQEKIIGDYDTEIVIYASLFAPIFFLGGIAAVWWGLMAAVIGGMVIGVVLTERMSNLN